MEYPLRLFQLWTFFQGPYKLGKFVTFDLFN